MKLANLGYLNLSRYDNLEIDDVPFFFAMAFRMIEDTDVVVYTVAKARGKPTIDLDTIGEALGLIQAGAPRREGDITFQEAPAQAFVNAGMVRDVVRAPMARDDQAAELLAKYVNFQLNNLLIAAAREAQREDLEKVLLRHLLRFGAELPYPLNRFG